MSNQFQISGYILAYLLWYIIGYVSNEFNQMFNYSQWYLHYTQTRWLLKKAIFTNLVTAIKCRSLVGFISRNLSMRRIEFQSDIINFKAEGTVVLITWCDTEIWNPFERYGALFVLYTTLAWQEELGERNLKIIEIVLSLKQCFFCSILKKPVTNLRALIGNQPFL